MIIDRSIKPEEKGKIEFQLPEIKKTKLQNGLNVIFVEKNNLPIVQFNFVADSGSKKDPVGKSGLNYLLSLLIDEGAGKYSALQLDDEVESIGSILRCQTDQESLSVSMLTLKEHLEKSLELLSLIVKEPRLTQDDFEREKHKQLTKIIQLQDDPEYIANSVFRKILFENSPYKSSSIGSYKDVENITHQDVLENYKRNFSPGTSTLIVVGNIEFNTILKLIEKQFTDWKAERTIEENQNVIKPKKRQFYIVHKNGSAQSEIRIGKISRGRTSDDFYARTLMNSILGGQFSSRINLNLREDKGFTYGAHSSYQYNKNGSAFIVSTGVESEHAGESVSEILKEIDGIRKFISKEELNFSKSYLIKRYPSMFETFSQVSSNLTLMTVYDLPLDYFNVYIDNIERTSLAEVEAAAKNDLLPEYISILVVGDKNIIKPQLERLTSQQIIELDMEGNII